jgi:hypothetical protein
MENENINQQEVMVEQKSSLHQVTPLSKYLALALFVILPFLGGWIGYTYAPEKVMEVEKSVVREVIVEVESENVYDEIDFSQCEQKIARGAMGTESGATLTVLGEDKQDGRCHSILRTATGFGGFEYQLYQCWIPKSVGIVSMNTSGNGYDEPFSLQKIADEHCLLTDEWYEDVQI